MANWIQNFPWAFQEAKVIGKSTATLETGEMDGTVLVVTVQMTQRSQCQHDRSNLRVVG